MKFTTPQTEFNAQLSLVGRAIPGRPSRPIMANALIEADAETQTITLVGFDEALAIKSQFTADVEKSGTLTLPAKLLGGIVSRLPSDLITLSVEADGDTATLTYSGGSYQVRGMSAEDYPALPEIEDGQAIALPIASLKQGLDGTLMAVSSDESKQVLTGVHLLAEPEALEFASTDGHRLAVVRADHDGEGEAMEVTVPGKALHTLDRMLQKESTAEAVEVAFDETQARFTVGNQKIITRLMNGQYPNYRQLIPKQFARQATISRLPFIASLERIAILAEQKRDIIKLFLNPTDGEITISVEALEVGSGKEIIEAQITGEPLEIAFNVRYLLDGLKAITTAEVQLQANAATSPVVLVPVGEVAMTYLVMPVSIRS